MHIKDHSVHPILRRIILTGRITRILVGEMVNLQMNLKDLLLMLLMCHHISRPKRKHCKPSCKAKLRSTKN